MLSNQINKVVFHGLEVQIQNIPDNHMIVNINGTSTLIHINQFQPYINVEQNVAKDTNKNVALEKTIHTNVDNANTTSATNKAENETYISENRIH